jgi:hypothetical protein
MSCKGTLKDLGRPLIESPRLTRLRWNDKDLKFIQNTWPEVAGEVRRREEARRIQDKRRDR